MSTFWPCKSGVLGNRNFLTLVSKPVAATNYIIAN